MKYYLNIIHNPENIFPPSQFYLFICVLFEHRLKSREFISFVSILFIHMCKYSSVYYFLLIKFKNLIFLIFLERITNTSVPSVHSNIYEKIIIRDWGGIYCSNLYFEASSFSKVKSSTSKLSTSKNKKEICDNDTNS